MKISICAKNGCGSCGEKKIEQFSKTQKLENK